MRYSVTVKYETQRRIVASTVTIETTSKEAAELLMFRAVHQTEKRYIRNLKIDVTEWRRTA